MSQRTDRIRIGANAASALVAVVAAYCFYRFNWLNANGGGQLAPWTTANAILRVATPAIWAFAIVSTWAAGERPDVSPALRWARRLGTIVFAPMVFCFAFGVFSKALAQLPM
jgi:hypothetical protein